MIWILSEPLKGVFISAESDGLHIRSEVLDLTSPDVDFPTPLTSLGKRLPLLIPQLLDLGLVEIKGTAFNIPYKVLLDSPKHRKP